jgi:hypothetical protein
VIQTRVNLFSQLWKREEIRGSRSKCGDSKDPQGFAKEEKVKINGERIRRCELRGQDMNK